MQGFSEGIPLLISALNDHSVIPIHSSTNRKTHGYHTISSDTLHNLRMSGYNKSNWWNNKIITTEENEWSHLWKDNKKAIGQLIGCLSNKEEKVRLEAVRSLGEINAKESLPFILELKDDDSREIKEAICDISPEKEIREVTEFIFKLAVDLMIDPFEKESQSLKLVKSPSKIETLSLIFISFIFFSLGNTKHFISSLLLGDFNSEIPLKPF